MTDFAMKNLDTFPDGTTVKAYAASNWPNGIVDKSTTPLGTEANSQTQAAGGLTFTGLNENTKYVAYAQVGGLDRYIAFRTPAAGALATLSANLGSPALGTSTAVHAAVTDTGAPVTVTTAITNPPTPRNVTATAGGTAGDIKAISVTVTGTNAAGQAISEVLPAFTVDTAGTVVGSKAFATVTSIAIPAHDGTGATTAVGLGAKLGLGVKLTRDSVLSAYLGGVREGTRPTVAISSSAVESNTVTLASALNGTPVSVDYYA